MTTHRTIRAAALVALAAVAVPAGSTLAGSDDGTDGDVVIDDPGDQANTITLPAAPEVGQSAGSTMALDMDFTMVGGGIDMSIPIGLEMDMVESVTELQPDGGYVVVTSLERLEVTDAPEGADLSTMPCGTVSGLEFSQAFAADGTPGEFEVVADDLTAAEEECAASVSEGTSAVEIAYPAEPVGVGAQWSTVASVESRGVEIPATYHYTLTDVAADGTFTIDVEFDADVDQTIEGADVTGTVAGSGSYTGNTANPLDLSGAVTMTMDMTITDGSEEIDMDVAVTVDIAPRAR